MSKLEEKLEELEYFKRCITYCDFDFDSKPYIYFEKHYCYNLTICIVLYDNEIDDYYLEHDYDKRIYKRQTINNLQKAFDIMQKDLEILKEVKDNV